MTLSDKNREETECYATMDDSYEVKQEKLQEAIEYLKKPDLQVIYNSERIDTEKFNEQAIVKESLIVNRMFNSAVPAWI
jgi:ABC-type branched-subunit amino acid transport system substrate-binding protein